MPGRYDEARAYYQKALKVATDMRFRPEIALTRLQLTELLLEHYPDEKSKALEHLGLASKSSTSWMPSWYIPLKWIIVYCVSGFGWFWCVWKFDNHREGR